LKTGSTLTALMSATLGINAMATAAFELISRYCGAFNGCGTNGRAIAKCCRHIACDAIANRVTATGNVGYEDGGWNRCPTKPIFGAR
jgi:hypothetical protein